MLVPTAYKLFAYRANATYEPVVTLVAVKALPVAV